MTPNPVLPIGTQVRYTGFLTPEGDRIFPYSFLGDIGTIIEDCGLFHDEWFGFTIGTLRVYVVRFRTVSSFTVLDCEIEPLD